MGVLENASPLEVAALWRLDLLSGDDIAFICLRWLEEDLDQGDPSIAAFAGQSGLHRTEAGPAFERFLCTLIARPVEHDEALLIALHLHLAAALQDDLMDGVALALSRFGDSSERRLVHNPRRAKDRPTTVFAEENLGLEYVYGAYHAFDDIQHLTSAEHRAAAEALQDELREHVRELRDHLATVLQLPPPLDAPDVKVRYSR